MGLTKTWKIGESASFGIWKTTAINNAIKLEGIDWDTQKIMTSIVMPLSKQSKYDCERDAENVYFRLSTGERFLTSYHAQQIQNWIVEKVCKVLPN